MSLMLGLSLIIWSCLSDVKSVKKDLVEFSIRLLIYVQLYMPWRYGCSNCLAAFNLYEMLMGSCHRHML